MSYYPAPGAPYVPQQPVNPYGGMGAVGLAPPLPNAQMQAQQAQQTAAPTQQYVPIEQYNTLVHRLEELEQWRQRHEQLHPLSGRHWRNWSGRCRHPRGSV